jgi:GntR family transcriptional regulator/MocR family aminotransferase
MAPVNAISSILVGSICPGSKSGWRQCNNLAWIYDPALNGSIANPTGMRSTKSGGGKCKMMSISSDVRPNPVVRVGHAQLSIILSESEKATLQTQIFDQIRTMILNGQLRGDDPLPTTRELSAQLGVSRNTAVLAYERLISEGYIRTKPYVGTFVSPDLPDTAFLSASSLVAAAPEQPPVENVAGSSPQRHLRTHRLADPERRRLAADFWVGRPDARTFPLRAWSHHIKSRLKVAGSKLTSYSDPAGLLELRQAISKHLAPARGVVCDPDQIIIVGGCQDAFNLVGRLLVTPGSPAVVESPCKERRKREGKKRKKKRKREEKHKKD